MDLHTSDDRKIIMVNSYVASGGSNISGSGVGLHMIPRDKERQKLWPNTIKLAKPSNLKHTSVCADNFLEEDYSNYKLLSESLGRNAKKRYFSKFALPSVFSFNLKESKEIEARSGRKKIDFFISVYIVWPFIRTNIYTIITQLYFLDGIYKLTFNYSVI